MSPIIYLTEDLSNTCIDILKQIIFYFSAQSLDELLAFFPTAKKELVTKSISIMIRKGFIQEKEYLGKAYYYEKQHYKKCEFSKYWKHRQSYLSSLDFVRILLNSTDEHGYLLNDIPYIGKGCLPCTIFFHCNDILHELYYISKEDKEFYVSMIQTRDSQAKGSTEPENSRIVIVDNESYIGDIQIKNVSHFAVYNEESRTFSLIEGTCL